MKLKYVPIVGLAAAFISHFRVTNRHLKNPTQGEYERTWEAFDDYHIALASTFVPIFALSFLVVALRLLGILK